MLLCNTAKVGGDDRSQLFNQLTKRKLLAWDGQMVQNAKSIGRLRMSGISCAVLQDHYSI